MRHANQTKSKKYIYIYKNKTKQKQRQQVCYHVAKPRNPDTFACVQSGEINDRVSVNMTADIIPVHN